MLISRYDWASQDAYCLWQAVMATYRHVEYACWRSLAVSLALWQSTINETTYESLVEFFRWAIFVQLPVPLLLNPKLEVYQVSV